MPSIAGFWSYAHSDDANDEGRIRDLAKRLEAEYELLTAERLELFIDESTLNWGDDWRERIAAALERVTFFIPVLTPTYFRRPECRKELMRFALEAKERQAERLIMPLYYVEVPELEADGEPADEAMAAVKPFQREDLRALRLKDRSGATYRRLVNELAERLIKIAREAEEGTGDDGIATTDHDLSPASPSAAALEVAAESAEDEGSEELFLERMAQGEEALGRIREPLLAISHDVEELGRLSREATAEMDAADKAGQPGFASRLAISKRLATRLEDPAEQMEAHAKEYVSDLWSLDPFVNRLLDWCEAESDEEEETAEKDDLMSNISELAKVTSESSEGTTALVGSLEESTNFSRDLRQPLRIYQTSLRNMLDGQTVIDQWARRVAEIEEAKQT